MPLNLQLEQDVEYRKALQVLVDARDIVSKQDLDKLWGRLDAQISALDEDLMDAEGGRVIELQRRRIALLELYKFVGAAKQFRDAVRTG